jgi:tRNA pseudouridine38-40 synthase
VRLALGVSYRGTDFRGWQSQPGQPTVQDALESALAQFVGDGQADEAGLRRVVVVCAGRTDTGVHALNQVVHLDASVERDPFSWVRGTNRFLPDAVAVNWCRAVPEDFHARNSARRRRYAYVLRECASRPSLDAGRVGWSFRPLDGDAMRQAAQHLLGEHDFSSFRSSECQAPSPVKTLYEVQIESVGGTPMNRYWRFEFEASAFLHHMVRNLMGCLVQVGQGLQAPAWMAQVLAARTRQAAAPTFAAEGLYFLGPSYDLGLALPDAGALRHWLPAA